MTEVTIAFLWMGKCHDTERVLTPEESIIKQIKLKSEIISSTIDKEFNVTFACKTLSMWYNAWHLVNGLEKASFYSRGSMVILVEVHT